MNFFLLENDDPFLSVLSFSMSSADSQNGSKRWIFEFNLWGWQNTATLRHCLHGRSFICNRIGFDAVTTFVYTAPVRVRYQKRVVSTTLLPPFSLIRDFQGLENKTPAKTFPGHETVSIGNRVRVNAAWDTLLVMHRYLFHVDKTRTYLTGTDLLTRFSDYCQKVCIVADIKIFSETTRRFLNLNITTPHLLVKTVIPRLPSLTLHVLLL